MGQLEASKLRAAESRWRELHVENTDLKAQIERLEKEMADMQYHCGLEHKARITAEAALARANQCLVDAGDSLLAQLGRFDELKAILSASPAPLAVVKGYTILSSLADGTLEPFPIWRIMSFAPAASKDLIPVIAHVFPNESEAGDG